MQLRTKACPICGKQDMLEVSEAGWEAWCNGELIQRALPELTADQREQLITGFDAGCWAKMFGEEEV